MKNKKVIRGLMLACAFALALSAGGVSQALALGSANDPDPDLVHDPMPEIVTGIEVTPPYVVNTVEDLVIMVNNHLYTYQSKDSLTSDQLIK